MFRAAGGRGQKLSSRPLRGDQIYQMVKRRFKAAGMPDVLTTHSFRAAVVTNLLDQKLPLEDVQHLVGHANPRTTQIYNRNERIVTRNLVERISS